MREVNQNVITVVVSGTFIDINKRIINYRVQVSLPNCLDEWLLSNITNRYLLEVIRNGKEYTPSGKLVDNKDYSLVNSIKSAEIEWTDRNGKNLIIDTGNIPTFYGKSIFDCSYMEIQDIATALGLHEIRTDETLEELKKNVVLAYLTRIKKIPEKKLKEMSFYIYDKKRMKYYIEFSETDKKKAVINNYQCADLEEFEEEERVLNGFRDMSELFDDKETITKKETSNKKDKESKLDDIFNSKENKSDNNNKITTI